MNLQQAEIAAIEWLISLIQTNETQWEADLGPIEIVLINDALKLADPIFAKLPFGLGGMIDQLFAKYAPVLEGDINQYIGVGFGYLIKYLQAVVQHLQGGATHKP